LLHDMVVRATRRRRTPPSSGYEHQPVSPSPKCLTALSSLDQHVIRPSRKVTITVDEQNKTIRPSIGDADKPDIIRAELSKSDVCSAEGFTIRSAAPVLALCRKLIDAGYDPDRPLHAYRGDTLCLKIRSIGEGAKLTVREDNRKGLRFVHWMPFAGAGGHPRIDESDEGVLEAAE
jgi:hypothetical protein